jgi:hypothetical protein
VNPGATHVAEVYARLLLPPDMRHMAGPGVVALQDLLKMVQGLRRRAPAQAHAHHEPPPEPRRSVHRRGRRVA